MRCWLLPKAEQKSFSVNLLLLCLMRRNFCAGYRLLKGVVGLPAAEGDGRGNCPDPCHKGETCHPQSKDFLHDTYQNLAILKARIFSMTPIRTLSSSKQGFSP